MAEIARVEAKDVAGHTPLHHCTTLLANDLTLDIAKVLLKEGNANINAVNRNIFWILSYPVQGPGLLNLHTPWPKGNF